MKLNVAKIIKPHGVRGALIVESMTDVPEERFKVGNILKIEGYKNKQQFKDVLHTRGIDSENKFNKDLLAAKKSFSFLKSDEINAINEIFDNEQLEIAKVSKTTPNRYLITFREISNRNIADVFRNIFLYIDVVKSDEEDAFYPHELVGLDVYVKEDSDDEPNEDEEFTYTFDELTKIAVVEDVITRPMQSLIVIRKTPNTNSNEKSGTKTGKKGKEILVPFVKEIVVEINEKEKYIVLNPPKGLIE